MWPGKVTRAAAPSLQGAKASLGEKGKIRQEDCRSSPFEYITPSAAEDATFFVAHVVTAYGKTSGDRGSSSWGCARPRREGLPRRPLQPAVVDARVGSARPQPLKPRLRSRTLPACAPASPPLAPPRAWPGWACPRVRVRSSCLPSAVPDVRSDASLHVRLINKTICPPGGASCGKVKRGRKMCVMFYLRRR